MGNDVTDAVLSIFNLGHMLHKMNYTHCSHTQKE